MFEQAILTEDQKVTHTSLRLGLAKVRKRRWLLWPTILIYLPSLIIALEMQVEGGTMGKLFACWVIMLCVAVGLATVVKCPRCNNPFHTNGPTFLPVRKCVHCGLFVNADKAKQEATNLDSVDSE